MGVSKVWTGRRAGMLVHHAAARLLEAGGVLSGRHIHPPPHPFRAAWTTCRCTAWACRRAPRSCSKCLAISRRACCAVLCKLRCAASCLCGQCWGSLVGSPTFPVRPSLHRLQFQGLVAEALGVDPKSGAFDVLLDGGWSSLASVWLAGWLAAPGCRRPPTVLSCLPRCSSPPLRQTTIRPPCL